MKKIALLLTLLILSCHKGGNIKYSIDSNFDIIVENSLVKNIDQNVFLHSPKENLPPNICEFLNANDIAEILLINSNEITTSLNNGTFKRSCFFKWVDADHAESAFLISLYTDNSNQNIPDWAILNFEGLRNGGITEVGKDQKIKFNNLRAMAIDGLYNVSESTYYWRLSNDVVFELVFNSQLSGDRQIEVALDLGELFIINYLDWLKYK